eukprot:5852369-Alexandrium_andersonii.AAC.1
MAGSQLGSSRRLPVRPRPMHQEVLCLRCLPCLLLSSMRHPILPRGRPVRLAASAHRAVVPVC